MLICRWGGPDTASDMALDPLDLHGFGVYANLGEPLESGRSESCGPEDFAAHAATWLDAGARVIGGCCGTEPSHIRALARLSNRHSDG